MKPRARRAQDHGKWLTAALLVAVITVACSEPVATEDGEVEIRIANESDFAFDRVDVVFPEQRVHYGAIATGSTSAYRGVAKAYRYAYIEVEVSGEEYRIQPIDYVGESLLEAGRYTYALDFQPPGALSLSFRID